MSPETLIAMISAKALSFGDMARGGKPEWTARDAAMACTGLHPRIYAALCFTYAGDESKYWLLLSELQLWAQHAAREEGRTVAKYWAAREADPQSVGSAPARIWSRETLDDLEKLAQMWLLEVKEPWRFTREENAPTPDLRRILMGVDKDRWRRKFSQGYEAMGEEFAKWIDVGVTRMRKRIRDFSAAEFALNYTEKVEAEERAKLQATADRCAREVNRQARAAKAAQRKAATAPGYSVECVKDERGHSVFQSRRAQN